jgi:hypothetical protein
MGKSDPFSDSICQCRCSGGSGPASSSNTLDTITAGHSSRIGRRPWYSILLFLAVLKDDPSKYSHGLVQPVPGDLLWLYERMIALSLSGRGNPVPFALALVVDGVSL